SSTYGLPRSLQNTVAPSIALYARLLSLPNNAARLISLMRRALLHDRQMLPRPDTDRLRWWRLDDDRARSSIPAADRCRGPASGLRRASAANEHPNRARNRDTS